MAGNTRDPRREFAGRFGHGASIYLDGESLTTRNLYGQGTVNARFLDRMVVLRCPQGTPFGANSLDGTIRSISKQPDAKRYSGSAYIVISSNSHGGTN